MKSTPSPRSITSFGAIAPAAALPTALSTTAAPVRLSTADGGVASYQVMVFAIAHQPFALPLSAISKVIRLPQQIYPFHPQKPFIIYGQEPVYLLNLYPPLAKLLAPNQTPLREQQTYCDFAILVWLDAQQQSLVPIDTIPQLLSLSPAAIYPLPALNQSSFSRLADHVAVIAAEESSQSILLLNLKKAQSLTQC